MLNSCMLNHPGPRFRIVWTNPAGPTSCLKCTAETEWTVASGPLSEARGADTPFLRQIASHCAHSD